MKAEADRSAQAGEGRSVKPYSAALVGDLLRAFDVAVVLLLGLAIYLVYVYPGEPHTSDRYFVTLVLMTATVGLMFQWLGVYSDDFVFRKGLRTSRMLSAWAVTFALFLAVAFALKISSFYSRVWAVSWFFSSAAVLMLARAFLSHHIGRLARRGRFANRTVIVGTGAQADRLAIHLAERDAVRTQVIGFIDDRATTSDRTTPEHGVLGGMDELIRLIRGDQVDQVFMALPWNQADHLRDIVHRLAVTPVPVRLAPDLAGFEFPGRAFADIAGLPMLPLFDRPISGRAHVLKVAEDRALAAVFLLLLAPALLLTALAVKMSSPGPVLFKQKRYGFNDQPIEVWKFRTMHVDMTDPDRVVQATRDDPRVTRIGKLLRRTSLDELPQLVNVLRGQMSIVGPRPHAFGTRAKGYLFEEVVDQYAARHRVKPGITGWAQVNGWRGETDTVEKIQKRVEYDLYYIDNWSIWLDLMILARTGLMLFRDDKAY